MYWFRDEVIYQLVRSSDFSIMIFMNEFDLMDQHERINYVNQYLKHPFDHSHQDARFIHELHADLIESVNMAFDHYRITWENYWNPIMNGVNLHLVTILNDHDFQAELDDCHQLLITDPKYITFYSSDYTFKLRNRKTFQPIALEIASIGQVSSDDFDLINDFEEAVDQRLIEVMDEINRGLNVYREVNQYMEQLQLPFGDPVD